MKKVVMSQQVVKKNEWQMFRKRVGVSVWGGGGLTEATRGMSRSTRMKRKRRDEPMNTET